MINLFILLLFVSVVVSGVVWWLERYIWKSARLTRASLQGLPPEKVSAIAQQPVFITLLSLLFPALLFVFVVRSFFLETYKIPTESMFPNFEVGDVVLINKNAYSLNEPLFNYMLIKRNQPQKGDVSVFMLPDNPGINYIKRIVGTPGDRITYKNKKLTVKSPTCPNGCKEVPYDIKTNNGKTERSGSFFIQDEMQRGTWVVPQDKFFVLGDNRDNSQDSRFWGFVSRSDFVGKVIGKF